MKFLIPDKGYWETGEITENLGASILADAQAHLGNSVRVDEVDAGPSASIPAIILDVMSAAADGLAIFAGPVILVQGVKWWKQKFQSASKLLRDKGLDFSVDTQTALLLSADAGYEKLGINEDVEIISVTRHWSNLNGIWSDHRDFDPNNPDPWLIDPHREAVRQLNVRYVILLKHGTDGYTAVVEKDGTVSKVQNI